MTEWRSVAELRKDQMGYSDKQTGFRSTVMERGNSFSGTSFV